MAERLLLAQYTILVSLLQVLDVVVWLGWPAHDRIVVLLRQLRNAAQRKDRAAVLMVLADLEANAETESQLARSLGMNDCSNM